MGFFLINTENPGQDDRRTWESTRHVDRKRELVALLVNLLTRASEASFIAADFVLVAQREAFAASLLQQREN